MAESHDADGPRRISFDDLVERVARGRPATKSRRYVVGIVGPPGAGKSTIAQLLADRFEPPLTTVPMDGFHLPNARLDELGIRDRKGAPDTFDAQAVVRLLADICASPPLDLTAPAFDRTIDEPTPGAVTIGASDVVVIVEGNYLLLDQPPWDAIRELLDLAVYVDLDDVERRRRLVDRHVRFGKSPDTATRFVERSDEPNAQLVALSRARADVSVDAP